MDEENLTLNFDNFYALLTENNTFNILSQL